VCGGTAGSVGGLDTEVPECCREQAVKVQPLQVTVETCSLAQSSAADVVGLSRQGFMDLGTFGRNEALDTQLAHSAGGPSRFQRFSHYNGANITELPIIHERGTH
jgi:hypothetical protein